MTPWQKLFAASAGVFAAAVLGDNEEVAEALIIKLRAAANQMDIEEWRGLEEFYKETLLEILNEEFTEEDIIKSYKDIDHEHDTNSELN